MLLRVTGSALIALLASLCTVIGASAASWSPDGTRLAFSYIGGPENIYIVSVDGRQDVVPVLVRAQRDFRPEWSPDGSHLVFTTVVDGAHVMMRVDPDGKNLQALSESVEAAGDPDYSPDGRRLVYFTDEPKTRDLFFRDTRTGKVTVLTDTPDFEEASPRWHPDGRRVVFVGTQSGDDVESDIWVLDSESAERRNLTQTPNVGEFHPDWSHDGKSVVYIRAAQGQFAVAIRNVDTGAETLVASGNGFATLDPHFAPDDQSVTFTRTDFAEEGPGMPAIVRVSLADGKETRLAKGIYLSEMPTLDDSPEPATQD